jgi:hypothetical protein
MRCFVPRHFYAVIIGTDQVAPSLASRFAAAGMAVAIIERQKFGGDGKSYLTTEFALDDSMDECNRESLERLPV